MSTLPIDGGTGTGEKTGLISVLPQKGTDVLDEYEGL